MRTDPSAFRAARQRATPTSLGSLCVARVIQVHQQASAWQCHAVGGKLVCTPRPFVDVAPACTKRSGCMLSLSSERFLGLTLYRANLTVVRMRARAERPNAIARRPGASGVVPPSITCRRARATPALDAPCVCCLRAADLPRRRLGLLQVRRLGARVGGVHEAHPRGHALREPQLPFVDGGRLLVPEQ